MPIEGLILLLTNWEIGKDETVQKKSTMATIGIPNIQTIVGEAVPEALENQQKQLTDVESNTVVHYPETQQVCSQKERKKLLYKMCEVYPKLNKTISTRVPNLIVDHTHEIAYCFIEKAGCSTWKTILANVSSKGQVKPNMTTPELQRFHASIDRYGLDEIEYNERLSNYTKFMVVRHPLERLLSAYRDKMRGKDPSYKGFAKNVVEKYRTQNTTNEDPFPTFQEFTTMVESGSSLSYNPHWAKYFYKCDPCHIRYDYILKLETMDHDMDMIVSKEFKDQKQFITEKKLNSFSKATDSAKTNFRHHLKPFEELSKDKIAALIRRFDHEADFFGYSFNQDTLKSDCCSSRGSSSNQNEANCCC